MAIKNLQMYLQNYSTDYQKNDWIKFSLVMALMAILLFISIISYLEFYLIPGLQGFTNTLELTSAWIKEFANEKADTISQEIKNSPDETILSLVNSGVEDVNEKANQTIIVWIAIGAGLIAPLYIIVKVVGWISRMFERMVKFDTKKRMIYDKRNNYVKS